MGLLSEEQVRELLELQDRSSIEVMLGKLMVAEGLITNKQLDIALRAQEGLRREDDKTARALGQAEVAKVSCATVINVASRVRSRAAETRRRITSTVHPAVGGGMLAAKAED
jgi:hypothetical protein